ncbi:hypothetical protein [Trueperella sp.]|uniref:hypothetical protein n=1 Tax=Trueperella sp. TaxID=2699835 RepID=UPI003735F8C0
MIAAVILVGIFTLLSVALYVTSSVWIVIPYLAVTLLGFEILSPIIGEDPWPFSYAWIVTGIGLFLIWGSWFSVHKRLHHALSWIVLSLLAGIYGIVLPLAKGVAIEQVLLWCGGGLATGVLVSAIGRKFRWILTIVGIPLISALLGGEGLQILSFVAFGWLSSYVTACLLGDESITEQGHKRTQ